jgi:small nuclear ribonucleoprotein (snRNP)-like protein
MKKTILLPFALLVSMHISAQKTAVDNVPPPVVTAFKTAYPTAEKAQWELDEENYEVVFVLSKQEKSAHYTADAQWLRTETPIRVLDVPKTVKKAASKNFKGYAIIEPVKVETEKGVQYKMELTKDDLTYDVVITEAGEMTSHKEKEDPNKKEEKKKEE